MIATLSPELIVHGPLGEAPWYLDSHVLVAIVIACILVPMAVCVAVAYTCHRTRTQTPTHKGKFVWSSTVIYYAV
ncbi:hypothetical protein SK128_018949 [Halocaridina rubra]|uniref:Uncharacterized protein n=1 Tax=Halocaridina rubra TaxID=373956 RepID=A0AAN8X581_HALRR